MGKLNKEQTETIKQLEKLWAKHPEYRLGQLIGNVFPNGTGNDPYHLSDSELIRKMAVFYDPKKNPVE